MSQESNSTPAGLPSPSRGQIRIIPDTPGGPFAFVSYGENKITGLGELIEIQPTGFKVQNPNVVFNCLYFYQDYEEEHELPCEIILDTKHHLYKVFVEGIDTLIWLESDGKSVVHLPQIKKTGPGWSNEVE